jgi:hypothetical protein
MIPRTRLSVAAAVAALWTTQSLADWTATRCDIYPNGSDHTDQMIPCVLAQRQGAVTINFMTDHVNATNHQVGARLAGDTWIVTLDNGDVYEVPLAAIEGG